MSSDGTYRCFDPYCTKEFDSLEEMVFVDGLGNRDGRHFCPSCSRGLRRTPEEAYQQRDTDTEREGSE